MSALDTRIANLQSALALLQNDQNAEISDFERLLLEANATEAILLIAGVVAGPNGTIGLPVTLIPRSFNPTAIQADFVLPASMTFQSVTLGPIATGEGKSIQSSIVGTALRVIVFGLNQTPITEGLDFTINLKTTTKGNFPIIIQNPVASDASGNVLPMCVTSGIVTAQ